MQYRPCDLCACLVGAPVPPGPGESIVCEGCLRSRRVRALEAPPEVGEAGEPRYAKHIYKFRCLYCGRKLRSKPVARDVKLSCPACDGVLLLGPGGQVSRWEDVAGSDDEMLGDSRDAAPLVRLHETADPDA